jgi:hypothetical protein
MSVLNLQAVAAGSLEVLVWCLACGDTLRIAAGTGPSDVTADLEGEPFKAYYCAPCCEWLAAGFEPGAVARDPAGMERLVLGAGRHGLHFATGPTPWGTGSQGPYRRDQVSAPRALCAEDRWPLNGTLGTWGPADLLRSLRDARTSSNTRAYDEKHPLVRALTKAIGESV